MKILIKRRRRLVKDQIPNKSKLSIDFSRCKITSSQMIAKITKRKTIPEWTMLFIF